MSRRGGLRARHAYFFGASLPDRSPDLATGDVTRAGIGAFGDHATEGIGISSRSNGMHRPDVRSRTLYQRRSEVPSSATAGYGAHAGPSVARGGPALEPRD